MEVIPNARMVDLKIVEVPYGWFGFAPKNELNEPGNHNLIKLIHMPSGATYAVEVPTSESDAAETAEYRARAKISFIHELHGESWLNE